MDLRYFNEFSSEKPELPLHHIATDDLCSRNTDTTPLVGKISLRNRSQTGTVVNVQSVAGSTKAYSTADDLSFSIKLWCC